MSNSIHCEQLFERFSRFLDLFDQHGSVSHFVYYHDELRITSVGFTGS